MKQIKATHPYGFRAGEWARLVCVVPSVDGECYLVEFEDGATDFWPVKDPSDPYEFRTAATSEAIGGDE